MPDVGLGTEHVVCLAAEDGRTDGRRDVNLCGGGGGDRDHRAAREAATYSVSEVPHPSGRRV